MSNSEVHSLQAGEPVAEQILRASRNRAVLDCAQATIAADEIRRACAAEYSVDRDPYGIRIANAVVDGLLNLSAFHLGEPLHFLGCTFNEAVDFEGADLQDLVFTGGPEGLAEGFGDWQRCKLSGLLANGVKIRRDLVLSGSEIKGEAQTLASVRHAAAVWLAEARVGGRLLAAGTKILTDADRAVHADRARFGGAVRLVGGFRATAEIRMMGAIIGGSFDLIGATLEPHNGLALDLAESTIGSLFLLDDLDLEEKPRLLVLGRIDISHMTVHGRVKIRGADLAPDSKALAQNYAYSDTEEDGLEAILGPGLKVNGLVSIADSVVARGSIRLPHSTLSGGFHLNGASLISPERTALDLTQSTISSVLSMKKSRVQGQVVLVDANVIGSVDMHEAVFEHPRKWRCIRGVGLRVSGAVNLIRTQTFGGKINFRNAVIDGDVNAEGAVLDNEGGATLSLHQAHVGGNVSLRDGFESKGTVALNRAVVEGRLRCDGGSFSRTPPRGSTVGATPGLDESLGTGSAFEAISATFRSGIELRWTVKGGIDLRDASTSFLADDPKTDWPSTAHLVGFTYARFAKLEGAAQGSERDFKARKAWLTRVSPQEPMPWEQAARVLRANGDHSIADKLLIAQRRLARKTDHTHWFGSKLRDQVKDLTVSYGYRPHRALLWLLALTVIVFLILLPAQSLLRASDETGTVYSPSGLVADQTSSNPAAPPGPCGGGRVRCFDTFLFAVDTVVPIIDLNQRSTWSPTRTGRGKGLDWLFAVFTALGWILSTIFVLSFARPARSSSSG